MKKEDMYTWTLEKLIRKRSQAQDMAALARQDGDTKDMQRRLNEAKEINHVIKEIL